MACPNCGRGFHDLCLVTCEICHPEPDELSFLKRTQIEEPPKKELRDAESTGRKRAANLYPLDINGECEWRGRKNCGGGKRPIIGCLEGSQLHRHHGPIKSTIKNHLGNVHRICTSCHVRWHELNDLIYDEEEYSKLLHDPQPATQEEVLQNHLEWVSGMMGSKFELKSSRNKKSVEKELSEDGD